MPGDARKNVIIGAGPIGLYLAIKLYQKGLRDICIIDPRAGEDTRPGHVHPKLIELIFKELGIVDKVPDVWHIRDVSQLLFKIINSLDITIIKQRFIDILGHTVLLEEGQLESDYVFDCSGGTHAVAKAVNHQQAQDIFKFSPVTDVIIKNHFIAYVSMDKTNFLKLYRRLFELQKSQLDTPAYDRDKAKALHELGWDHYASPYLYAVPFKNGKFCIYMDMPDGLAADKQEAWFDALLQYFCNDKTISYQRITGSKNGRDKPYFNSVIIEPQFVNRVSFQSDGWATVILAGDNLISHNYRLGTGIRGGMLVVDGLLNCLSIFEGRIVGFNAASHQYKAELYIDLLREQLIEHYRPITSKLLEGLLTAQQEYQTRFDLHHKSDDQEKLGELSSRICLASAALTLYDCLSADRKLIAVDDYGYIPEIQTLTSTTNLLIQALQSLPLHRVNDINSTLGYLQQLTSALENSADQLFKASRYISANRCYNLAIKIHQVLILQPGLKDSSETAIFRMCTSLIACFCQLKKYSEALVLAEENEALLIADSTEQDAASVNAFISNYLCSLLLTLELDEDKKVAKTTKIRELCQDPRLSERSRAQIKHQFAQYAALFEAEVNEELEQISDEHSYWYGKLLSMPCSLL